MIPDEGVAADPRCSCTRPPGPSSRPFSSRARRGMRPDAALMPFSCPSCGAIVVAGELRHGGHALFACFEPGDTSSAYLLLPTPPWRIAPRFVGSIFGDHALHGCVVTTTLAMPACVSG